MLKVGIIGSGFGRYGLLPAFAAIPRCKVVALAGKKTKVLIDDCKRFGLENIYDDWRELLENEQVDAIAVAVTPRAQYDIVKVAIGKGLHVLAEKPLAIDEPKAKELLRLAKKKGIINGVDFIFPEIAAWEKAKELLDKKTYGELWHISADWDFLSYDIKNKKRSWKTDSAEGGGALSFYFSHGLYYLEHFAGKISNLKSTFTHSKESLGGGEVGVDMLLRFKNGVTGQAHICCNCRGLNRHRIVFECDHGTFILENENSHVAGFTLTAATEKGKKIIRVPREKNLKGEDMRVTVVRKLAARFVDSCIREREMAPSFADGVRVQELITKIHAEEM